MDIKKFSSNSKDVHFLQYIESDDFDLQKVCRICLFVRQHLLPLSDSWENSEHLTDSLANTLSNITNNLIDIDDNMPNQICYICREDLMKCVKFKEKCSNSDATLKSVIKGEYVKEEPDDLMVYEDDENRSQSPTIDADIKDSQSETHEKNKEVAENLICQDKNKKHPNKIISKERRSKNHGEKRNSFKKKLKKKITSKELKASVETVKTYSCNLCIEEFPSSDQLSAHAAQAHGDATFACAHCAQRFTAQRDLDIHGSLHGDSLSCAECNKEFKLRSRLARHVARHLSRKRFACAACAAAFSERHALRRHARTHVGAPRPRNYACEQCGARFSEPSSLRAHSLRHVGATPFACACGRGFRSARLLASHARTHSDHKPHECTHCQRRFRHVSTLRAHVRTHTGERPYVCAACGRAFVQRSNLTLHTRTHTGERPYACNMCARRFTSSSALKSHARTHDSNHCRRCGMRLSPGGLQSHICSSKPKPAARPRQQNTALKKFDCIACDKKFSTKKQLDKHAKTHEQALDINNENQYVLVQKMTDFTPYNCTEEMVIMPPDEETNLESVIIEKDAIYANLEEEEIPTHVCLTQNGINYVNALSSNFTVSEGIEGASVRMYQIDQTSLVQIHSSGGQLTISKITSKMTANFEQ